METQAIIEIRDNAILRQFETTIDSLLITLEYSFQEKKIFLTRLNTPQNFNNEDFITDFLKSVMAVIEEKKFRVVPINPKIVMFFKKNPIYKELLPPGIRF